MTDKELVSKLKSLVSEERRIIAEVLDHLREVDRRKLYADYGCQSLWEFCVRELGYSEGCAMRRISSMRLIREIPEVREDLLEGRQTLSSLASAQQYFRTEKIESVEEKREILSQLEGKSSRECEKVLFNSDVKISVSEQALEKLKRLLAPGESLSDAIERLADEKLRKLEKVSPPAPAVTSRHIPAATKRAVWHRDQGRCTWKSPDGKPCDSRVRLELDHVIPYALGGATSYENLRLRCRAHNAREAVKVFGPVRDLV
jgi:hypothetical protein